MQTILKKFLILIGVLLGFATATYASSYTFTVVNFPGALHTRAWGMNAAGHLAGNYFKVEWESHGFLFNGSNYSTIDVPGGYDTDARDINNAGQITGQYFDSPGGYGHGFLYDAGTYTTIFVPGSYHTYAEGLNNNGHVVGWCYLYTGGGVPHGFLYDGSNYSTIDVPGASWTTAYGVNDADQIVGYYADAGGLIHGFLYDAGTFSTIDVPGSYRTRVTDINGKGHIVGFFDDAHGFLFDDSTFTTIDVPGAFWTAPSGINDAGQIVGVFYDASGYHGFLASPISILEIDTQKNLNEPLHHTDRFRTNNNLILRRGDVFSIKAKVTRAYKPENYEIYFQAQHDFNGSPNYIQIPAFENDIPADEWGAQVIGVTDYPDETIGVEIRINIPPNVAIGEYLFKAFIGEKGTPNPLGEKLFPNPIVILFNPWSEYDDVYMPDDADTNEYVLNEFGLLWRGKANEMSVKGWRFAQFDEPSLEVILALLNGLTSENRADPAIVARHLSAEVNSKNGSGILEGRWHRSQYPGENDEDYQYYLAHHYDGGEKPWFWSGSDQILKRFKDGGGAPVRYAQCWVFGGVLTTALRCVGIPARPITNFESAHDADKPLNKTADIYYTPLLRYDQNRTIDSIWSYHVWCDAWMKRTDRPGYDGWQAVDATPQELSDSIYRLGPAPVSAVRSDSGGDYDVDFVFAEVDADVKHWWNTGVADVLVQTDEARVGQNISTKDVGSNTRNDISSLYKASLSYQAKPKILFDSSIEVTLNIPSRVDMGSNIVWSVNVSNISAVNRSINVVLTGAAADYNGTFLTVLDEIDTIIDLDTGEDESISLTIPVSKYNSFIKATNVFQISIGIRLVDTTDVFLDRQTTLLVTPEIEVSLIPSVTIMQNESVECRATWTNPLTSALHNAFMSFSVGQGLSIEGKSEVQIDIGNISPGQIIEVSRDATGLEVGEHLVSVVLVSDELSDTHGHNFLEVTPGDPCSCDLNQSGGSCNFFDWLIFIEDWGSCTEVGCSCDLNEDGSCNFFDWIAFIEDWGRTDCP